MKRIIENSIAESNVDKYSEPLKLRLRGRGSGYKEGPENMGEYYNYQYFNFFKIFSKI
jgi:hypothetical protein